MRPPILKTPRRGGAVDEPPAAEILFGWADHFFASLMYALGAPIDPDTEIAPLGTLDDDQDGTFIPVWYDSNLENLMPYMILPAQDIPVGVTVTSVTLSYRVRIMTSVNVTGYTPPGPLFQQTGIGFWSLLIHFGVYEDWTRDDLLAAHALHQDGAVKWDVSSWGPDDPQAVTSTDWAEKTIVFTDFQDWTGTNQFPTVADALRAGVIGFDIQHDVDPSLYEPGNDNNVGGVDISKVTLVDVSWV